MGVFLVNMAKLPEIPIDYSDIFNEFGSRDSGLQVYRDVHTCSRRTVAQQNSRCCITGLQCASARDCTDASRAKNLGRYHGNGETIIFTSLNRNNLNE